MAFIHARTVQVLLLFASRIVSNGQRLIMSPLVIFICKEFPCTRSTKGNLLSAYSFGYLSTQILGGLAADKLGAKGVLIMANGLASIAMLLTPFSADHGTAGIWVATMLVGLAQGPNLPACVSYLTKWVPPEEKGVASAALDSGMAVSALFVVSLSAWLADSYGWRMCFYIYGVVFLIFTALFAMLACTEPDQCWYITEEEKLFLKKNIPSAKKSGNKSNKVKDSAPAEKKSLFSVILHPAVWSIFFAHMCYNYSAWILASWQPTYYEKELGVNPSTAGLYFTMPHIVNLCFKLMVAPPIFKFFYSVKKYPLIVGRRWVTGIGFLGTMIASILITSAKSWPYPVYATTGLWALSNGFIGFHSSGMKANYMDVSLYYSGTVSGVGNTLASMASWSAPVLAAWILDNYSSWNIVFASLFFSSALGALGFCTLSTSEALDKEDTKKTD